MGDIYHAGEVYAGSVPIDDTQASEDTVYSSAKVETMIEEIQDTLKSTTVSGTTTGGGNLTTNLDGSLKVLSAKSLTTDAENAGFIVLPVYIPSSDKWSFHLSGMNGTTPAASKAVELVVYYTE